MSVPENQRGLFEMLVAFTYGDLIENYPPPHPTIERWSEVIAANWEAWDAHLHSVTPVITLVKKADKPGSTKE